MLVLVVFPLKQKAGPSSRKLAGLGQKAAKTRRRACVLDFTSGFSGRDLRTADGSRTGAAISLSGSHRSRRASRTTGAPSSGFSPGVPRAGFAGGYSAVPP